MAAMRGRPSARVGRRTAADATARVAHRVSADSSHKGGLAARRCMHAGRHRRRSLSDELASRFSVPGVVSERRAAIRDGSDAGANRGAPRPVRRLEADAARGNAGRIASTSESGSRDDVPTQSLVVMAQYSKHDTR